MDIGQDEIERLIFFERAREKAAQDYESNPLDAANLIRWGGALLELAQFQSGPGSMVMVQEAEAKLEEALTINSKLADGLWCLGNAHTTHGFLLSDPVKANELFKKASKRFQQALEVEPNNELYQKAVEMSAKAPELHQELQKQLIQQASPGSTSRSTAASKGPQKKKSSDLKYDILGWVILAVGVSFWIRTASWNQPAS